MKRLNIETDDYGTNEVELRFIMPSDDEPLAQKKVHMIQIGDVRTAVECRHDNCQYCESSLMLANLHGSFASRKRSERMIALVQVVNDRVNPENNGQIMTYSFAKLIMNRIRPGLLKIFGGDGKKTKHLMVRVKKTMGFRDYGDSELISAMRVKVNCGCTNISLANEFQNVVSYDESIKRLIEKALQ